MDRMDRLAARIDGLEGRVIAHRRTFQKLLELSPEDMRAQMLQWLEDREVMLDGQEDPGALAGEEAALELALSDEMRLLHDLATASRHRRETS
ncbi:hypothetical protein ACDP63_06225 [Paracoccus sp. P2]|uniref:Uncharacterized protein n=1 Tax=Paracoccus pantotrophus TaxID=82367 RepID=A0A1I5FDL2_PARPN|nr:hypothetical protein [Paracoccus pantotrophus]MDF3853720.1 hypothetical protein [Paracoccus pantotrophus]QFG34702.1 hypothetical protein ESD82_00230 [Paracoccus pantotrophus]QLH12882.1 hypothetical protein HYQ43_00760 [Paracoccus pantotrophus]RDD97487.1 hypothetical protein DTW92_08170 [Paracoccus pantotrophus]RKS43730.1 hypothetical protein BDE18_2546 [Paracoccus pantotrophus]